MTADSVAIVVLAKQPRPGRVKTRLQPEFSAGEAAALAAAALRDSLAAVLAIGSRPRLLAWEGDPTGWDRGFHVAAQPAGDLNERLRAAFAAVWAGAAGGPVERALLIGMDTPQVRPEHLSASWGGADAVLGLSDDGGFWAIGLRAGHPSGVFDEVLMSTDRTGASQLARLQALGLTVGVLPTLRDVDRPADAEAVATAHPELEFARCWRALVAARQEESLSRVFDEVWGGGCHGVVSRTVTGGRWRLALEVERWRAAADAVDGAVVARCEPPVLDIGCGPGRMVRALAEAGRAALGIDMSAGAVRASQARGAPALRRRVADRLPAEGRWRTALLMDGNVGIGGDVTALLRRCAELLDGRGLVICEVDPDRHCHEVHEVILESEWATSLPTPWARVGAAALHRTASSLGFRVDEDWTDGGRAFVALRRGTDAPG